MRILNENGPFICDKCGSKHPSRKSFFSHNHLIHRNFTVFCDLCSRSFHHKYLLSRHIKQDHLRLRPFECKICEYKTFLRPVYNRHMLIHNSKSECKVCHKSVGNMKEHSKNHDKVKCPICSEKYSKVYINYHVKTHARRN